MVLLSGKEGTIAIGIGDHGIMAMGFHFGWCIVFKVDGNKRLLSLRLLPITEASVNSQKALAVCARNWMPSVYRVLQRGRVKTCCEP